MSEIPRSFTNLLEPDPRPGTPTGEEWSEEDQKAYNSYYLAEQQENHSLGIGNKLDADPGKVAGAVSMPTKEVFAIGMDPNRRDDARAWIDAKSSADGFDQDAWIFNHDIADVSDKISKRAKSLGLAAVERTSQDIGSRFIAEGIDTERKQLDPTIKTIRNTEAFDTREKQRVERAEIGREVMDVLNGEEEKRNEFLANFSENDARKIEEFVHELTRRNGNSEQTSNEDLQLLGEFLDSIPPLSASSKDINKEDKDKDY